MYDFEDDRRWPQRVAVVAVAAAMAAGVFVFVRGGADRPPPGLGARAQAAEPVASTPGSTTRPPPVTGPATAPDIESATGPEPEPSPTTSALPPTEPVDTPLEASPRIIAGRVVAAVEARIAREPEPTILDVTTTTAPGTVAGATPVDELGYPAAPDGTPLPIVATYDVGSVTLAGHVPSEAARARLIALARANSQDGADIEVRDRMVTNERVPLNVGVRVIESNSPRFGEGAAVITAEHAAQLDRVGSIMHALPNVTALVVGHADQRGDEATNFELSHERAVAVVDYLVYLGVAPTRLASKAAGEQHLLTLDDDAAALALNRRTEFVFHGILVD